MAFTNVCSLKTTAGQLIQPNTWTLVHFEGAAVENVDDFGMHDPDAVGDPSGLITVQGGSGWGLLAGMAQWDSPGDATETRAGFVRDPLGVPDTTATNHFARTPGGDYVTLVWPLYLPEGRAHGLRVYHNATTPRTLTLAEFKLMF